MNKHSIAVFLALMLSLTACSEISDPDVTEDGAPDSLAGTRDAGPHHEGGAGSNDSYIQPYEVLVSVSTPGHLWSDVSPDVDVNVNAYCKLMFTPQQCLQLVESAAKLVDRTTRTPVAGAWSYTSTSVTPLQLTFKPTAPLAKGDYLVQVTKVPNKVEAQREVTMFHVGPMPRIAGVQFFYSKKTQGKPLEFDILKLRFSEKVDLTVVKATFENEVGGAWKKLSTMLQGSGWRLPAPLDVNLKLRVTVEQDVGAVSGLKLDGLYTGKPGSGDFTATCLPATHTNQQSAKVFVPEVVY